MKLAKLASATALPLAFGLFVLGWIGSSCGGRAADAEGKRRIAVIPKGTTHEFWKSIHAGALAAGNELGVEIIWKGPLREDDRDEQIKVVEDFVVRGVDGIVLAPLDETALTRPAQEADERGIPVIVIDSDLAWDGRVSYVATDNYQGGVMAARELGRRMGGAGKALLLRYVEGSASTERREAGFLDTLRSEFPDVELLSENQHAGATVDGAYKLAENLLLQYPEVEGVFCPCEPVVFGMWRALQDANRAGEVQLVGFDAGEKLVQGLEAGEIHALVVQNPFAMGRLGVERMVDHLEGRAVEPRVDTGVVVATRENMQTPEVHGLLFPDLSSLGE